MEILKGVTIINMALNLPGPAAAQRLGRMGAEVIKLSHQAAIRCRSTMQYWVSG